ncbi:cache domain-containing protein [Undibacterium sp. RuRC25W]|uniref:cache domain-containing protein n=1 Tax=Undibacterium sp. RuRC25W TaxID=3413047 RepID=UPI003BF07A5E
MKLRYKFILLTIIPLLLSFAGIAIAVFFQATNLAKQQHISIEKAYLNSKETELKHYVSLGRSAIDHLYQNGTMNPKNQEEAKRILAALDFGDDGYFYVYDMHGKNLMHPRQPELVGKNLWALSDPQGNLTIQKLIHAASQGGGPVRYLWEKPSTHQVVAKLGYVIPLQGWDWVLGTGIYLDDVDAALDKVDAQFIKNIHSTLFWIAGITIICALLIALSGLALNISESRLADAKLKTLARSIVTSQEDERARLSRDLHDGLSQLLVSTKLQIESGVAKLESPTISEDKALIAFARATKQINSALTEVRRISHNLRPAMLDDLGLVIAFEHLSEEFHHATGIDVTFTPQDNRFNLNAISNTVLYRVAQEALTNIHKHAHNVSHVEIKLHSDNKYVTLLINDNGTGFNLQDIVNHPKRGIGLSNMRERMASVQGQFDIQSGADGTRITAKIPNGE